jgi:hypothetical protein
MYGRAVRAAAVADAGGVGRRATIAAAVMTGPRVVEEVPEKWVAVGGAREPAAVVPLAGAERLACVRDPGLHPEAWAPLLAALGYRGVAGISASRGGGAAPHVVAVREELAASGLWRPQDGLCGPGDEAGAGGGVKRCLSMTGQRMAAAREGECFVGGAWVAVKARSGRGARRWVVARGCDRLAG